MTLIKKSMYIYKVKDNKEKLYFSSKKKALQWLEISLGTKINNVYLIRIKVDGVASEEKVIQSYYRKNYTDEWVRTK